jgi:hypothetical protein
MTRIRGLLRLIAVIGIAACATLAQAQQQPPLTVTGARIQKIANGVLGLMGYSVVPDLTSSTLAIDSAGTGNPQISMSQLAGGFTTSRTTPVYLEGGIAYSRYDPTFIATSGEETRSVPVKWISVALTGGVGYDFPVAQDLVFRPIFNFALGQVTSDLRVARFAFENRTGAEIDFLDRGHHNAYGLGGSVMLDYEMVRPDQEVDVELRYTAIRLQSFGSTAEALRGHADAVTASLYTRYRAPTGMTALDRPVRYVLEYAFTRYLGDQPSLGFNNLHSIGAGLELDSSAHEIFITRTRLVGRYRFGNNVSGFGVSLAVSF